MLVWGGIWWCACQVRRGRSSPATAASGPWTRAAAQAAPLSPPVNVSFGDIPSTSLAAVYIAQAHGYFEAEGLNVTLEPFANAESMIPVMAQNQLDVSGGGVNSAMFSAIGRGLPIKIVAGRLPQHAGDEFVGDRRPEGVDRLGASA